ncbi:MAG: choice-of-anchor B family protein [Ignavibacteria bacterium]
MKINNFMRDIIIKIFFSIAVYLISTNLSYGQLTYNTYLLANLDQYGNVYSACWGYSASNGREYAILGCVAGTSFVDITDSANIHEVDFLPGLSSGWREMKVYSHYAYIVSEAVGSGLQIVDLQYLPDSVHLVRTFTFSGYARTHSISQSGPYLYLNGGNYMMGGVFVLDLTSNPELPVKRGEWETRYVHDCRVRNDTIWACNISSGHVTVINAMNKDNLFEITNWVNNPNPSPHNCDITTDRRYILTTDENSIPGKLKVWNIQNLNNITLVTSWQPTGITTSIVHNVEIYGNLAVVAHYTAGIRIVDISNPTTPTETAWYDTYPNSNSASYAGCWGVFRFPSGKIIGSDMSRGLFVIKIGTLTSINGQNNSIPVKYELYQNYPNPFNPSTTIEYSLLKNGHVSLKIYNSLGEQVAVLVDEYATEGKHRITYDASRLASGVYFYNLTADDYSETKKMTFVK